MRGCLLPAASRYTIGPCLVTVTSNSTSGFPRTRIFSFRTSAAIHLPFARIVQGIRGIERFRIQILHVRIAVCESPGNSIVVSDNHERRARQCKPFHIPTRRREMNQVPDTRHGAAPRCVSFASSGLCDAVWAPLTTKLLLPIISDDSSSNCAKNRALHPNTEEQTAPSQLQSWHSPRAWSQASRLVLLRLARATAPQSAPR